MSFITRLASGTRATAVVRRPVTDVGKAIRPPTAANVATVYSTPGMPQTNTINGNVALQVGYYGHLYSARCAIKIAQTIAGLPIRAGLDPNKPDRWDANAPLARLLGPPPGSPAPGITPRALIRWSLLHYLFTGRYSWETVPYKDNPKSVGGLFPLPSMYLNPIESEPPAVKPWSGFVYQTPKQKRLLRVDQVHYGWRPSLEDWRKPETPLQWMRLSLDVSEAMDIYMRSFMRNNMALTTLIVTPPFGNDNLRQAFQDQFMSSFTGAKNAGSTLFSEVDGAKDGQRTIQVEKIGASAKDAQLLELKAAARDEVLDGWGVPRSLLGNATERTYENADQEHRNYWTGTVLEWIAEFQDAVNTDLSPRLGDEVMWFDLSQVAALKPPMRFQPEPASALVAAGIVDGDEAREEYGLDPRAAGAVITAAPVPDQDDTPGSAGGSTNKGAGLGGRSDELVFRLLDMLEYRYDTSPLGTGKNWVTKAGGLPLFIRALAHAFMRPPESLPESEAIQRAIGDCYNWAEGRPSGNGGKPSPKTQAKAVAAIAEFKAKAASSHGGRDVAVITEHGLQGAGLLLPVGPASKTSKAPPHRFVAKGGKPQTCEVCGLHRTSSIHKKTAERAPEPVVVVRHSGPGHLPVPTGHAKNRAARRLGHSRVVDRHARATEGHLEASLHELFTKQAKSTVSRLQGNRGRQMVRDTVQPVEHPEEQPLPPVDAAKIFDVAFWTDQTAGRVGNVFQSIQALIPGHVGAMINLPADTDDSGAVASVDRLLRGRANQLAGQVTDQTYKEIIGALTEGVNAGDGISALTSRVQKVFDNADRVRAQTIARTEVQGAVNGAQLAYGAALPNATELEKEWLATPDDRTRESHKAANGQRVPLGQPFDLGPEHAKLMYSGDPQGPPEEVINCRCTQLIVPMNEPQD